MNIKKFYRMLIYIQALLILLLGFSIIDFNYVLAESGLEATGDGFLFNQFFFGGEDSVMNFPPFKDNDFWTVFAFWGYLILIVGFLQLIKAELINKI